MENIYSHGSIIIDVSGFEEYLKYISNLILKPSKFISEKRKELEFKDCKKQLYRIMDKLSESLKEKINLLHDEYFYFAEIYEMVKYTLNRDISEITVKDIDFISDIFNNFLQFLDYRLTLIEDNIDDDNFESEVELFLTKMDKSKEFYFANICKEDMDKGIFIEYCNVITA